MGKYYLQQTAILSELESAGNLQARGHTSESSYQYTQPTEFHATSMAEESGKLLQPFPCSPLLRLALWLRQVTLLLFQLRQEWAGLSSFSTPHSVLTVHLCFAHSAILTGSEERQLLCWRLTCLSVFWNTAHLPLRALDPSISSFLPVSVVTSP